MSIISILWCMFGFTFITIPRFFHLVRLLFVHLLLMSVDIWLDFTFVRAFSHLCFLRFLTAGILCLLLWLLSDTFPITSALHSSQEYDVLSWILVWWMRRRNSSVELLPHSVQRYVVISLSILATNWWKVWWKPIPPKTLTLNLQVCKYNHFLVRSIVQLQK